VNRALLGYLARRYAFGCAAGALLPILLGIVMGIVWPEYRAQLKSIGTMMKFVQELLRSDLLPPDSAAFFFQIPFAHPATMLALILAVALPTIALPAGARGRGSLDLLLATALTRRQMVVTTSVFVVPFALLLGFAPFVGTWLGGMISDVQGELPLHSFLRVSYEAILLALFFGGLSQLLSVLAADAGSAIRWLAVIVLFSLFAEITGTTWKKAIALKYCSPFGYYEPAQVIAGVAHFGRDCSILAGAAAVFFIAALVLESRRRSA
jgi:hypothetical protein